MSAVISVWGISTFVALLFALSSKSSVVRANLLPFTAGALLGTALFWILPEVTEELGWVHSLIAVGTLFLLLQLVDRQLFPLCPFCATGLRNSDSTGHAHHAGLFVVPILALAAIHSFIDGWTLGVSQAASARALFWGITIHKIPESAAAGLLASRLAATRGRALAAVALIQTVMGFGSLVALSTHPSANPWLDALTLPLTSLLLLYGIRTLQEDEILNGRASAIFKSTPVFILLGLAAFILRTLPS